MMKKMLLMVLTALTVVGFSAGCSNTEEENTGNNTEENTTENTEENAE